MTGPTARISRQQLVERLSRELTDRTLEPGSRLPSERQLAERFQISRPVVREVLRQLQERGLIEIYPGSGAFVRSVSTLDAARMTDGLYRRGQATPRHLVDARLVLECRAASLAAHEATEKDLAAMEAALHRFDTATTVIERAQADLAFHALVARTSRNPVLELMFGSITRFVFELMLRSLDDPSVVRRGVPQHEEVVRAIRAGDETSAASAMHTHISLATELYGADLDEPLDMLARRRMGEWFDSGALDTVISAALGSMDEEPGQSLLGRD